MRVGLVGCGRVAQTHHAPVLARHERMTVTAVIDPDPDARAAVGRHHPGAVQIADLDRALQIAPMDALVICTPPRFHASVGLRALEHGLHVYIEKPVAVHLAEAHQLQDALRESDRVAMVGHNFRLHPSIREARRIVKSGGIGPVTGIRGIFCSEARHLQSWKTQTDAGGDAIMDLGIHHLDLIPFVTGLDIDIESVSARLQQSDVGSAASLGFLLEAGQPASLMVSQISGQNRNEIEVLGETAHLKVDLVNGRHVEVSAPSHRMHLVQRAAERATAVLRAADVRRMHEPSFAASLDHFYKTISNSPNQRENLIPVEAGVRALEIAIHAAKSTAESDNANLEE
ncbi:Inositol 2-dehydrogenase/D-chiro-inositol 3-dehydrogenase (plasmid) [Pseudoseohaeicola sp. NH-UV-7]|uniref:Gfo/Idh/MocA family protein n=1 Tax=Sulfitobacter sp. TBRI5 TaxID=2989732 RepID=UPI003A759212